MEKTTKNIRFIITDENGFEQGYFQKVIRTNKDNKITIDIDGTSHQFNDKGILINSPAVKSFYRVTYNNPLSLFDNLVLRFECEAYSDEDAKRIAIYNEGFMGYINLKNYNKAYLRSNKIHFPIDENELNKAKLIEI